MRGRVVREEEGCDPVRTAKGREVCCEALRVRVGRIDRRVRTAKGREVCCEVRDELIAWAAAGCENG